jgi:S-formylglutathione hydrolase FrmB
MKSPRLLGLFSLIFLFAAFARALLAAPGGRIECKSLQSKVIGHAVNYCVVLPPSYGTDKARKYPVLYFFHGLGDNEQMFIHGGAFNLVQDLWERKQISEFLIVTPEAGATFYINSHNGRVRYEDFLIQEFIPEMETRYRVEAGRQSRGVSGVSMGGYGALHLAFRHPELFVAVSAHSPALITEIPAMSAPNPESSVRSRVLGETFGNPPDPSFWDRNNPISMARRANLAGLQIYFDCGDHDDFGFEDGAKALDKTLHSRRIPHEAHIYPGGHDWRYFAEHLPASLEFQSHAFGK